MQTQTVKVEVLRLSKSIIEQMPKQTTVGSEIIIKIRAGTYKIVGWMDCGDAGLRWLCGLPKALLIERGKSNYIIIPWHYDLSADLSISSEKLPQIFI